MLLFAPNLAMFRKRLRYPRFIAGALTLVLAAVFPLTGWAQPSADRLPVYEIPTPTSGNSQQHHLALTADRRLILSWVETDGKTSTVRFAIRQHKRWSPVRTVTTVDGKLGDPPVVMGLSDGSLAAAWMPYISNTTDRYAADIVVARSLDGGQSWSQPLKPYGDSARIYDAQMSLAPLPDGQLALVWTDMRHASHDSGHDKKLNRYQLMATVIDQSWQASPEMTLDDDVCSCCRVYTDVQGGDLLSVYRDHAPGEVRDIAAVRWQPQSVKGSTPVHADHWVIPGCPSNGPSVDLLHKMAVVAWFSAADGKGRVKISFSPDQGAHFQPPVELDNNANGFVNTLLLEDGSALAAWRGRKQGDEELKIARVSRTGKTSHLATVYQGGFPKWPSKYLGMERIGKRLYVVWTDPVQKKVRLTVALLPKKWVAAKRYTR
jgi:hypothetical protein